MCGLDAEKRTSKGHELELSYLARYGLNVQNRAGATKRNAKYIRGPWQRRFSIFVEHTRMDVPVPGRLAACADISRQCTRNAVDASTSFGSHVASFVIVGMN